MCVCVHVPAYLYEFISVYVQTDVIKKRCLIRVVKKPDLAICQIKIDKNKYHTEISARIDGIEWT